MAKTDFNSLAQELRKLGLKLTPARLTILYILKSRQKPLSIAEIKKMFGSARTDLVTVYRNVEALVKLGVVKKVLIDDDEAYYEYKSGHHHHLVCNNCGMIEDFHGCNANHMIRQALTRSKHFRFVNEHSLELFGLCKNCT